MSLGNLKNLVKTGQLKIEAFNQKEFDGLINSGKVRFQDASNNSLAIDSRFDLAYNAAHSFALAALRKFGFRANNRYIVFQALQHTLEIDSKIWRVLALCHDRRNLAEYEGYLEIDEQLLIDLLRATEMVLDQIKNTFKLVIS